MSKPKPLYVLKLRNNTAQHQPDISFWPQGRITELRVGSEREFFGTAHGPRTLEKFARALLAEVAPKPKRKAKRGKS